MCDYTLFVYICICTYVETDVRMYKVMEIQLDLDI